MIGALVVLVWLLPVMWHAIVIARRDWLWYQARPLMTFLKIGRPRNRWQRSWDLVRFYWWPRLSGEE
jgi:hypothetical protein